MADNNDLIQRALDYQVQKDLAKSAAPSVIQAEPIPAPAPIDAIVPQVVTPEQSKALLAEQQLRNSMARPDASNIIDESIIGAISPSATGVPVAIPSVSDLGTLAGTAGEVVSDALTTEGPTIAQGAGYKKWRADQGLSPQVAAEPVVAAPLVGDKELEALAEPTAVRPVVIEPSEAEISAAFSKLTEGDRQVKAAKLALDEVDKMREESEKRQAEREAAVQADIAKLDSEVRSQSFNEIMRDGTFGQKTGAAIAMLLGGLSQGLTGAKTNPVMDFYDRIADRQAAKDKLNLDQKQMLKQQLYQQGTAELQKLENATNNAYRKDQIRIARQELEQKQNQWAAELQIKLQGSKAVSDKYSGKALTPETYASLSPEERHSVVTLQDGRRVMASNPTDAREYKKFAGEVSNALNAVNELQKLAKTTDKTMAITSPLQYAKMKDRAEVLKQVIVGALRLPFTGPGVLTDVERQQLINVIGSPLDLFSIKSLELAKLNQVKDSLSANLQSTATSRGVLEQVVPEKYYNVNGRAIKEEKLVELYKQKMPDMPEDKIRMAIQRQLPGI